MKIDKVKDLLTLNRLIEFVDPDFIVVEGYNCVGKSRVISSIQEYFNAKIYRPDYNSWASCVPKELRWTIFSSILSFESMLEEHKEKVIFDRGFVCGTVYNGADLTYYKDIVKDAKVLHVLVTVPDEDTYLRLANVRDSRKVLHYDDCREVTLKYRGRMNEIGLDYVEFVNHFDKEYASDSSNTCRGCSHYNLSDSKCKHPRINGYVEPDKERCEYSGEMEVQDGKELQSV